MESFDLTSFLRPIKLVWPDPFLERKDFNEQFSQLKVPSPSFYLNELISRIKVPSPSFYLKDLVQTRRKDKNKFCTVCKKTGHGADTCFQVGYPEWPGVRNIQTGRGGGQGGGRGHGDARENAAQVIGEGESSTEFKPETEHPCIGFMPEGSRSHMGGTTHLGSRESFFNVKDSKSPKLYDDKNFVDETHPYRYEVNPDMVECQEKADLSLAAKYETGKRIELVDDLRSPMNEQENCSDYMPTKSQHTRRTIPSKQEEKVEEDLVKTQKKGIFITEEARKRNHKNPPCIYLTSTIIILLALIIPIKSVSLDMATKFSFSEGQTSSNLTPSPVSYISPSKVHQVFLNFRGEQLRYSLVSHVTDAFKRHEIKYFIDELELRGNGLNHLLVRIEESSIALAFFSTRYSESKYCMDELVKMKELAVQRKLRVIPIFYKVKAKDVRKPTHDSEFGKNFWKLAESNGDKVKAWTEALECIAGTTGLPFGENRKFDGSKFTIFGSSESDFVNKIVEEVKKVEEAIELEEEE